MFARISHLLPARSTLSIRNFSFTTSRRALDMETVNTTERLRRLRELMKQHKVDIYSMRRRRHLAWSLTDTLYQSCRPKTPTPANT